MDGKNSKKDINKYKKDFVEERDFLYKVFFTNKGTEKGEKEKSIYKPETHTYLNKVLQNYIDVWYTFPRANICLKKSRVV